MKSIFKISMFLIGALLFITSCNKADDLPYYNESVATQLSASTNTINVTAANAAQDIVTFSWSDAQLATDSANQKYTIEIAPKGSNFINPISYTVFGKLHTSILGSDINNALVKWGIAYATPQELEVRCISSYKNNNDLKHSNVVAVTASAYAVPFTLSATATGPFEPTASNKDEEFSKITWTSPDYGTSTLTYTIEYVLNGTPFTNPQTLPTETGKLEEGFTGMELYQMANTAGIPLGTSGKIDVRIKAIVSGTNQASYSNIISLTVKPVEMTLYMYVPGDHQGWNPSAAPRIASTDGIHYEGYVWVPAGGNGEFKVTPAPNWEVAYGGDATTISTSVGNNLKFAASGAMYLLKVNTQALTWSATRTDWGLIGGATVGGWDNSTPMSYDNTTGKLKVTTTLTEGQFKFRANNGWDINLGSQGGDGTSIQPLKYGGGNLPAIAGVKTVYLDLRDPGKFTYTIE